MFKKNEQDTVTPRNKFMFLAAIAASFSLAMLATTSAPQENNVAPLSGVSSVTTTTNENSLAYAALSVERHPKKQVPSWQMITPYMGDRSPKTSKQYARAYEYKRYKWGLNQFACLVPLWEKESGWTYNSYDPAQGSATAGGVRKTWGVPQANPGTKMASAGKDWRTNPRTQIRWGIGYIHSPYGTPCGAWSFWRNHGWY